MSNNMKRKLIIGKSVSDRVGKSVGKSVGGLVYHSVPFPTFKIVEDSLWTKIDSLTIWDMII